MSGMPLSDTSPAVASMIAAGYRRMTATEKLDVVRGLNDAVQRLALADIRRRHPTADAREHALRLASRWISPDLMTRVFGWNPRVRGY